MPKKVPGAKNVKGMLLEEALLYLLRHSGYRVVESDNNDDTLTTVAAGLAVKGRGTKHQIDAIADFVVQQPFCNPQRLLLEAKCLDSPVRLPVVRNALGVLRDVTEYWPKGEKGKPPRSRYHYSYAVFASHGYTKEAQQYAFAQDIYLITLQHSHYIKNVIREIEKAAAEEELKKWWPAGETVASVRKKVRDALRIEQVGIVPDERAFGRGRVLLGYFEACLSVRFALLGLVNRRFPVLLVPAENVTLGSLEQTIAVRPRWDHESWYLYREIPRRPDNEEKLFSFDLPPELFAMYANSGTLTASRALDLKGSEMREIQAVYQVRGETRILQFELDRDWLDRVRGQLRNRR